MAMSIARHLRRSGGERAAIVASLAALVLAHGAPSRAQDSDALAKAAQNPVAAMISLPFQNNTFFGVGPHGDVALHLAWVPAEVRRRRERQPLRHVPPVPLPASPGRSMTAELGTARGSPPAPRRDCQDALTAARRPAP
jgi:hypothetical protein